MIDLERERRIQRKISELGHAIESAGDRDAFEDDPVTYLREKATAMQEKTVYSVDDVAELFDMKAGTVRRWIRNGKLEAAKLGRDYRVSKAALESFWKERGGGELFADNDDQAEGGGR